MPQKVPIYHLYGEESDTPADFWLHCETITSRSQLHHYDIGMHRHEHLSQMLYVSTGQADALIDSRIVKTKPPCVVLVPAGFDHGFRFSPDIQGLVITMLSSHALLMQRELPHGPQVLALSPETPDAELIASLLERIGRETSSHQFGRSDMLAASLSMTMLLAIRALRGMDGENRADSDTNRMEDFASFLRQHLRQEHSASFYAQKLGVSPTHLNRLCQASFGQSTRNHIANLLVSEIKRDLIFTNDPIQLLSFRFGFSDPTYFSRFFTKQVKRSPAKWREDERLSRQVEPD